MRYNGDALPALLRPAKCNCILNTINVILRDTGEKRPFPRFTHKREVGGIRGSDA